MNDPNQTYLLNNLIGVATGHTTGEFQMDAMWAGIFLRMLENEPGQISFQASVEFARALEEFKDQPRDEQLEFALTLWRLLNRCCDQRCRIGLGQRAALGMFLLFDQDIRWHCERGGEDDDDDSADEN